MRRSFIVFLFLMMLVLIWASMKSYGADSTVNYKNQPPPSAIAPSVQSYSQMICSFPVVGAVSTSVVGISTGTTFTDWNCERRALSNSLSKAGLKVASISVLCAGSKAVWSAMLHSGTPCSIWNGKKALIGKEAIKHYKMMGYINEYGQILRYPDYLGANGVVSNFSNSNRS
jgi:ABC-type Fe3+ transport system permease subunit